ncbi:MAG: hypothetical protein ACRBBV_18050 [Paracoccaceae bacterium]
MTHPLIPKQLALPLHTAAEPRLSPSEQQAVITALAQLLLAATKPGGPCDE